MASKYHFPAEVPEIPVETVDFSSGKAMHKISLGILKDQEVEGLQRPARTGQKL